MFSFSPTMRNWSSARISNSLTSVPLLVSVKLTAPATAVFADTAHPLSVMSTVGAVPLGAFGTHPASARAASASVAKAGAAARDAVLAVAGVRADDGAGMGLLGIGMSDVRVVRRDRGSGDPLRRIRRAARQHRVGRGRPTGRAAAEAEEHSARHDDVGEPGDELSPGGLGGEVEDAREQHAVPARGGDEVGEAER